MFYPFLQMILATLRARATNGRGYYRSHTLLQRAQLYDDVRRRVSSPLGFELAYALRYEGSLRGAFFRPGTTSLIHGSGRQRLARQSEEVT